MREQRRGRIIVTIVTPAAGLGGLTFDLRHRFSSAHSPRQLARNDSAESAGAFFFLAATPLPAGGENEPTDSWGVRTLVKI